MQYEVTLSERDVASGELIKEIIHADRVQSGGMNIEFLTNGNVVALFAQTSLVSVVQLKN